MDYITEKERQMCYFPMKSLDLLFEKMGKEYIENHQKETLRALRASATNSDEEIAAALVKSWVEEHTDVRFVGTTITIAASIDVSGIEPKYLGPEYWEKYFREHEESTELYWSMQFKENETNYRRVAISEVIPDDPVPRMVLHFLRSWRSRLSRYILDEEIPLEERKLVFTKQIENFAFFSRKKQFACQWKVNSEPDELLQQALDSVGVTVVARDKNGEPLRSITGRTVTISASEGFPKSAAAGPSPDEKDKKIYKYVCRYAVLKLGQDKLHSSWTLVKSSFHYRSRQFRCYAFSGQPNKERNRIPLEWWEKNSGADAWNDDEDVQFADGNNLQLGNGLVLSLFKALKPSIEEDLNKMTLFIAKEEYNEAASLIEYGRKDMSVLDYGSFYDFVMTVVINTLTKIKKAVSRIIKSKLPGIDTEPYVDYLMVGGKNQQFMPNKQEIQKLLSASCSNSKKVEDICHSLCKMSETHLCELKEKLNHLPRRFLDIIEKRLKAFKCGEDKVIDVILYKLLHLNCNDLTNIKVRFVAMDADQQNGKRFCAECAEKVKFYSVLPILLRDTGFTGDDFPKLAPFLKI